MKVDRFERELRALIMPRKSVAIEVLRSYKITQLPFVAVLPEPADFCCFPEIRAVLYSPTNVHVDESNFQDVIPLLPGIFDRWREEINRKLTARVQQAYRDEKKKNVTADSHLTLPSDSASDVDQPVDERAEFDAAKQMQLATTVFKCRTCAELVPNTADRLGDVRLACHAPHEAFDPLYSLSYPQVLAHRCLTRPGTHVFDSIHMDDDPTTHLEADGSRFAPKFSWQHRQQWDCSCLAMDVGAGIRIAALVKSCGLDPATATADHMDNANARFGCMQCMEPSPASDISIESYGWRSVVSAGSPPLYVPL